jgi:hypothetical protein
MNSYIIKRNVIIVVLLDIVTFGIYGLYLFFAFGSELKREVESEKIDVELTNPFIAFLLTLLTLGIYGLYYTYKQAEALEDLGMNFGYRTISRFFVLFLAIFFNIGRYLNIYSSSEYLTRKNLRA